jgi:hypothetical protein
LARGGKTNVFVGRHLEQADARSSLERWEGIRGSK